MTWQNTQTKTANTLTQEGGTEPRKATTLSGTVKAYVLDFQALNAASNVLSSNFSTLSLLISSWSSMS